MRAPQLALAGFAGLPLAMLALPVYLHTPALYAREFGLSLLTLGSLLFAVRLVDTVLDPCLGYWQDRLSAAALRVCSVLASAAAAGGFVWLLAPVPSWPIWPQLIVSLLLVYLAHGWLVIALLRYGALLWPSEHGRARVVAWREAWGVLGILLASALPVWWASSMGEQQALQQFVWVLLPCGVLALLAMHFSPAVTAQPVLAGERMNWRGWSRLLLVLLLNALAMAIPATLLHFYVADVLQTPADSAAYLLGYFLSAVLALPLWVKLADRYGKSPVWLAGMLLAIAAFVPVLFLQAGDSKGFLLVCILTGMALGSDLALAAALVADRLGGAAANHGGKVFGVMSMLNKLALALAAGVALPLAALLGYQPGQPHEGLAGLYAGLPMLCKTLAAWLLWREYRESER